jgi:aminopeptidase N
MTARPDATPVTHLRDYRAPAWRVDRIELEFDLDIDASEVVARLQLRRERDEPLRLNGEGLELLAIRIDGRELDASEYRYTDGWLALDVDGDAFVLETHVRLRPSANTAFEGLYLSGKQESGFLLTQCEAQGFRHITFFPDRPDVLAAYTVTLRADRERFPVLLAGGNPDGAGELEGGRHWARFVDPHPKPCYLFALVAGRLERISRDYTTADGRAVALHIWAEADAIDRCGYAMDALERSMRWDERAYGRNYDLDVFHIVATHDFNMGAMENKGLNIFNAKYLLADPDSSTDDEYRNVEAVVAHEYFHNWSGNRVTCRDWFQLSLKEGLTVFREQSFSADMNSAPLKRIEDVSLLRRAQFPEDAGPLSHPVRPTQYSEINNFYTATVYEKGSELVRMLAGALGEQGFRRGMDVYFERHDGQAATIEDFLAALGDANGMDLSPYLAWYGQAGTPRVSARGSFDAASRRYTLALGQHAAPGRAENAPLPIPVKLALFAEDGRMLPLRLDGETAAGNTERVIVLDRAEQVLVFVDVDAAPVPSLLRGFSAPVVLECDYAAAELGVLLRHDVDGFNRWEAGQRLAALAYDEHHAGDRAGPAGVAWCSALATLAADRHIDDALLAELLTPPGEIELAERHAERDPDAIRAARQNLLCSLARHIGGHVLRQRYDALVGQANRELDAKSQARRRLSRRLLELLSVLEPATALPLALARYEEAPGMTERLASLSVAAQLDIVAAAPALAHFRQRYADNPLALDKWFVLQAVLPGADALARVRALEDDPAFTLKNPNRVQSLMGSFARANATGFHRTDGAAYRWLAERLTALDTLNPQVAARLATALNGWNKLEPVRREAAHAVVVELAAREGLSSDLADILRRVAHG